MELNPFVYVQEFIQKNITELFVLFVLLLICVTFFLIWRGWIKYVTS